MATRGGTPSDHVRAADWLLDQAPVLVVAEIALPEGPEVVGWSGATQTPLHPGGPAQWLAAGLTVDPAARHRAIGRRLLQAVIDAVGSLHGDTLRSVVNARNAPSLALHHSLGFTTLETGPCLAGIEFDGGVGVLLTRPTGVSAQPRQVLTLRP
ncbi:MULTISPECIES: GNAT family N-acetyltransferase [Micrococcus]|uniref:GNAT family N-acetyltransferase n=1 Tax=Micrococcus TaxID=1269 RepID=UPI000F894BB9|nr:MULTISPECIES: GNAT family N-acetyltransferase [Micrococcus]MBN6767166.1 GNAT family N-acetyltransferase [Micrococcus luteus]MBN6827241.1 GNAT family N-acetyltransferase [Micrococcus luteus]MBN6846011.1 GNAT family N-acetyltransferase [Micrococcus luteus]MBN6862176.1 GNAT family N-acetyltransferase [Micrococcus luteus]MBN6864106.1 GNAT family N-acetyltransferase [Micrococcus luteus]